MIHGNGVSETKVPAWNRAINTSKGAFAYSRNAQSCIMSREPSEPKKIPYSALTKCEWRIRKVGALFQI